MQRVAWRSKNKLKVLFPNKKYHCSFINQHKVYNNVRSVMLLKRYSSNARVELFQKIVNSNKDNIFTCLNESDHKFNVNLYFQLLDELLAKNQPLIPYLFQFLFNKRLSISSQFTIKAVDRITDIQIFEDLFKIICKTTILKETKVVVSLLLKNNSLNSNANIVKFLTEMTSSGMLNTPENMINILNQIIAAKQWEIYRKIIYYVAIKKINIVLHQQENLLNKLVEENAEINDILLYLELSDKMGYENTISDYKNITSVLTKQNSIFNFNKLFEFFQRKKVVFDNDFFLELLKKVEEIFDSGSDFPVEETEIFNFLIQHTFATKNFALLEKSLSKKTIPLKAFINIINYMGSYKENYPESLVNTLETFHPMLTDTKIDVYQIAENLINNNGSPSILFYYLKWLRQSDQIPNELLYKSLNYLEKHRSIRDLYFLVSKTPENSGMDYLRSYYKYFLTKPTLPFNSNYFYQNSIIDNICLFDYTNRNYNHLFFYCRNLPDSELILQWNLLASLKANKAINRFPTKLSNLTAHIYLKEGFWKDPNNIPEYIMRTFMSKDTSDVFYEELFGNLIEKKWFDVVNKFVPLYPHISINDRTSCLMIKNNIIAEKQTIGPCCTSLLIENAHNSDESIEIYKRFKEKNPVDYDVLESLIKKGVSTKFVIDEIDKVENNKNISNFIINTKDIVESDQYKEMLDKLIYLNTI